MSVFLSCFSESQSSFCWWLFSQFWVTLSFVWPDIRRPIGWHNLLTSCSQFYFDQNIKRLNPHFTYHHHDIILKIITKSTSKEKYRKVMTIKIWLRNLDKCSRSIKSCLRVGFPSWKSWFNGFNLPFWL